MVLVLQPRQARAPGTLAETPTSGGPPGGPVAPARGTPWLGSAARDEPLRWTSVTLQGPPWPSPNPPEEPPGWAPQPGVSPSYGPPCTQRAALVPGLTRPKHPLAAHMFQHSPSAGAHAFQNLGFSYCAKGSRPNRVKPVSTEEEWSFAPPIVVRSLDSSSVKNFFFLFFFFSRGPGTPWMKLHMPSFRLRAGRLKRSNPGHRSPG